MTAFFAFVVASVVAPAHSDAAAAIGGGPKNGNLSAVLGCDKMVECMSAAEVNTSIQKHKHARAVGCPGVPECSAHGRCHGSETSGYSCHCAAGFFGHDCSPRHHDCARLRSCSDCQHPANTKFCGWCASGRYCVPKHVHRGLVRKGKACPSWYEDTCPAPRNHSGHADHFTISEYDLLGDDSSVALAEALVAMIDEAGGEVVHGRAHNASPSCCITSQRIAVHRIACHPIPLYHISSHPHHPTPSHPAPPHSHSSLPIPPHWSRPLPPCRALRRSWLPCSC